MQAMLLAAGLGTRLRPYTLVRPKPLFPVLNRPLLSLLLDMLRDAGCSRAVVNGHHLGDQIWEAVKGREETLVYQHEPEILGTGGGLREALANFDEEPILVMNGDIFHNIDLESLHAFHVRSGNRVTLALHDFPRFNMVGVWDGAVSTFRGKDVEKDQEILAFTGIHIVEPSIIEMIPPGCFFHIIDLYEDLVRKGERIGYLRVDGALWEDIGTPADYLELHGRLLSGENKQILPMMSVPSSPWLIGKGARVSSDVEFSGWGCVGNARVGSGVRLRNCVVWDNAVIEDDAQLENAIVIPRK